MVPAQILSLGGIAQRLHGLKQRIEGVECLGFFMVGRGDEPGDQVAGSIVGRGRDVGDAGQVMGLQRLARDMKDEQELKRGH